MIIHSGKSNYWLSWPALPKKAKLLGIFTSIILLLAFYFLFENLEYSGWFILSLDFGSFLLQNAPRVALASQSMTRADPIADKSIIVKCCRWKMTNYVKEGLYKCGNSYAVKYRKLASNEV